MSIPKLVILNTSKGLYEWSDKHASDTITQEPLTDVGADSTSYLSRGWAIKGND